MITEINLKTISILVAVFGLIFSVIKFIQVQEIEAAKPYLMKKLAWCEEAVEIASSIATSKNEDEIKEQRFWELYWGVMGMVEKEIKEQRFWELYWGVMGTVEKEHIRNAMIAFGDELKLNRNLKIEFGKGLETNRENLEKKSLAIAHACRDELAVDWSPSWAR